MEINNITMTTNIQTHTVFFSDLLPKYPFHESGIFFQKARGGISATILRERFMEQEFRNNSTKKLVGKNVIENQDTTQKTSQKTSQKIVELIQNNNEISTQEMANIIGIDRRNIARQIKNLQAKGSIRRVGPDKGGHWEVIDNREK